MILSTTGADVGFLDPEHIIGFDCALSEEDPFNICSLEDYLYRLYIPDTDTFAPLEESGAEGVLPDLEADPKEKKLFLPFAVILVIVLLAMWFGLGLLSGSLS